MAEAPRSVPQPDAATENPSPSTAIGTRKEAEPERASRPTLAAPVAPPAAPPRRANETTNSSAPVPLAVEPISTGKTAASGAEPRKPADAVPREPAAVVEAAALPARAPGAPPEQAPLTQEKAAAAPQEKAAPPSVAAAQDSSAPFRRGDLIREGDTDVVPPILRSVPEPRMPSLAARQRRDTMILVRVLVDENGNVTSAEVQDDDPSKKVFHAEAMRAAKGASFDPGTKGGVPGKMYSTLPVRFKAGN
jgi:TonB family protein